MRLAIGVQLQPRRGPSSSEPAEADRLYVQEQPDGANVDEALAVQPVIRILDQYGQPFAAPGVTVTAAKLSGPGALGGTLTAVTDENGVATFQDLELDTAGEVVLRFTAPSLTQVDSAAFDVAVGDEVDADLSSIVATPSVIAADGIEEAELLATAVNSASAPIAGLDIVLASEVVVVSASQSSVEVDTDTIPDDETIPCNVIITVRDAAGRPIAGLPANAVGLAVSGTGNTITPAAGVTNSAGVIIASFVSTVAEAKTPTVTVNGVELEDQPEVTVTGGAPEQVALIFASDWSRGGAGDSVANVTDDGRWTNSKIDNATGNSQFVIDSTGLGFPAGMDFVLRHRIGKQGTAGDSELVSFNGANTNPVMAPVAIGNTRYGRIYFRTNINQTGPGGRAHLLQSGALAGGLVGYLQAIFEPKGGGKYDFHIVTQSGHRWRMPDNVPDGSNHGDPLDINATYRLEWAMTRTAATTFRLQLRLYNAANELLFQSPQFTCRQFGHSHATPDEFDSTVDSAGEGTRQFMVSNPGTWYNFTAEDGQDMFWGAVAFSNVGWIGGYVPGEDVAA